MAKKRMMTGIWLMLLLTFVSHAQSDDSVRSYQWVELAKGGQQLVRVATTAGACPQAIIDGASVTMTRRGDGTPPDGFAGVLSCELPLSDGVASVSIDGQDLPVLSDAPKRILVMGDTGCAIGMSYAQNCNGVEKGYGAPWPFAALSESVAKQKPDLIIHTGDYHYRTYRCPKGNLGCADNPYGYNWEAWEADFFKPAAPALSAAPWVFIRGNHEACGRAWKGWYYFLDSNALPKDPWNKANCNNFAPTTSIPVGKEQFIIQDTSVLPGEYRPPNPEVVAAYVKDYNQINQMADQNSKPTWLLSHRPVWGIVDFNNSLNPLEATLQQAIAGTDNKALSSKIKLLLSGHIHAYQTLSFNDQRPPMVIVGNSGTKLYPAITPSLLEQDKTVLASLGLLAKDFTTHDGFGYVILSKDHDEWKMDLYSYEGKKERGYELNNGKLVVTDM